MTRRSDGQLRSAISVIEAMLLTTPSSDLILQRCLNELMNLLGATFGYVYKCGDSVSRDTIDTGQESHLIPWELACTSRSKNGVLHDIPNSSTSYYIPNSLIPSCLSGRCLLVNEQQNRFEGLPHSHPEISNYFCIPLIDARHVHAVIFLCNTVGGFPDTTEQRIRPFIAAASCLLRAAEKHFEFQKVSRDSAVSPNTSHALLKILDTIFNAVIVTNKNEEITLCNTAAASMLGLPRREVVGRSINAFLPSGSSDIDSRLSKNDETRTESDLGMSHATWRGVPIVKDSGKKILVDLSAFEILLDGENQRGLVLDDISERLESVEDYQSVLQRFQVLTNLAPVGILQLNREWECTYANDTWCNYCQMTPEESVGIGWLEGLHPHDADEAIQTLRNQTRVNGKYEGEFRLQSPLGHVIWAKVSACSLYESSGEISGLIITFNDVTDHRKNEERLQDIAEKDQLTGLINRAFFNDRLEIALKGAERFGTVVLMFLDLDEFKHINDTYGHDVGDELLRGVAVRLSESVRNVDTIARIGGDEFTILMTNVKNTSAITGVADKIIDSLSEPFIISKKSIYATSSIGIAVAKDDHSDAKTLLKQADIALYKAKEAGRNQYKFHTVELDDKANLHMLLRQSLKESGRKDFRVVYQPQVDARTGEILGLEALTRWQHEDSTSVGPDIFIKMIEESGLLNDFSVWLLEDIFSTLSRWYRFAPQLSVPVSINLSAKQLRDKDLSNYIHTRCKIHGVPPEKVILEVTETALIDDPTLAIKTLKKLRKMGFGLSLDDFGTGYSSLAYLRDMPFNTVKIDRTFIADILHNDGDAKIVSAIIKLAAALDLEVIAEGVESSDIKNWLIQHDCTLHQGFYYNKPMEKNAIEDLLKLNSRPTNNLVFLKGSAG